MRTLETGSSAGLGHSLIRVLLLIVLSINPRERLSNLIIAVPTKVHIPARRLPLNLLKLQMPLRKPQSHLLIGVNPSHSKHLRIRLLLRPLSMFGTHRQLHVLSLSFMKQHLTITLCTLSITDHATFVNIRTVTRQLEHCDTHLLLLTRRLQEHGLYAPRIIGVSAPCDFDIFIEQNTAVSLCVGQNGIEYA